MGFETISGLRGKVYVPEKQPASFKKHPCQDCFSCQQCSEDRCRVCLDQKSCRCNTKNDNK